MIAYEGDGKWQEYEGGYEDYTVQKKRFDEFTQAKNVSSVNKTLSKEDKKVESKHEIKPSVTKSKLSNKEKAELDKLPNQIEQLEKRQLVLSEQLANPEIYKGEAHVIVTLKNELTQVEEQMTRSMKHWEELLEKDSDSS
jgi:ATP-binding cassette subfamily F protein uup